jgi:molybdopterin-guanine dinucleotide biosynthesis protein A
VVGAVLAGGRGRRLGGGKATALLAGRPLLSYPLAAMAAAGIEAFVVAKPDTELPPFVSALPTDTSLPPGGAAGAAGSPPGRPVVAGLPEVVLEAAEPSHPLVGIIAALRHAGRPVVVLAGDMPLASPALLAALAGTTPSSPSDAPPPPGTDASPGLVVSPDEPLVVPAPGGEPEPLQARWSPALLPALEAALAREEPLRRTVASLAPRLLDDAELARFGDPARTFLNVNDAADLERAERALAS